jgi:hypothetical protein
MCVGDLTINDPSVGHRGWFLVSAAIQKITPMAYAMCGKGLKDITIE